MRNLLVSAFCVLLFVVSVAHSQSTTATDIKALKETIRQQNLEIARLKKIIADAGISTPAPTSRPTTKPAGMDLSELTYAILEWSNAVDASFNDKNITLVQRQSQISSHINKIKAKVDGATINFKCAVYEVNEGHMTFLVGWKSDNDTSLLNLMQTLEIPHTLKNYIIIARGDIASISGKLRFYNYDSRFNISPSNHTLYRKNVILGGGAITIGDVKASIGGADIPITVPLEDKPKPKLK